RAALMAVLGAILLLGAAVPAGAADERLLENAATKARVLHPGSRFKATVDVAPSKFRLGESDEPLGLYGLLEQDGKLEPLGRIGGGTARGVGRGGQKGVELLGDVPPRVAPRGRLPGLVAWGRRLPRPPPAPPAP